MGVSCLVIPSHLFISLCPPSFSPSLFVSISLPPTLLPYPFFLSILISRSLSLSIKKGCPILNYGAHLAFFKGNVQRSIKNMLFLICNARLHPISLQFYYSFTSWEVVSKTKSALFLEKNVLLPWLLSYLFLIDCCWHTLYIMGDIEGRRVRV